MNVAHQNRPRGRAARSAIRFPGHDCAIRAGRPNWPPCFSPRTKSRREILGSRSRFALPTVAPGQNSGGAPYRQLYPAYPLADYQRALLRRARSPRAKGSAGTFQRGSFRTSFQSGNVFLKSPTRKPHTSAGNSRHTASLDELAEPNYYSNSGETSSTNVFASQLPGANCHKIFRRHSASLHRRAMQRFVLFGLLNPAPASTLQVFRSNS